MSKLPCDYEIQTVHLITARLPDLVILNKTKQNRKKRKKINKNRTCRIVDFSVPLDHGVKLKKRERRDKY